jgi:hypothetical protein
VRRGERNHRDDETLDRAAIWAARGRRSARTDLRALQVPRIVARARDVAALPGAPAASRVRRTGSPLRATRKAGPTVADARIDRGRWGAGRGALEVAALRAGAARRAVARARRTAGTAPLTGIARHAGRARAHRRHRRRRRDGDGRGRADFDGARAILDDVVRAFGLPVGAHLADRREREARLASVGIGRSAGGRRRRDGNGRRRRSGRGRLWRRRDPGRRAGRSSVVGAVRDERALAVLEDVGG